MRQLFKFIVWVIAIIIIVFVIAGVALVVGVNPNNFKKEISQLVENQTGRQLIIKGNISLSYFPWIGVRMTDVALSNPAKFPAQQNFAHADEADINVRMLPLFTGNVEVGKIVLRNLNLSLIKQKNGQNNWQDLMSRDNNTSSKSV